MKMRLSTPAATRDAWLAAGRLAAGAVLLGMTVSACTSGGSSVPSTFTPTPLTSSSGSATQPATRTPSPAGARSSTTRPAASSRATSSASSPAAGTSSSARASASATAHTSAPASTTPRTSASASASATTTHSARTPSATHSAAPHATLYPTAAPETGGGGTAGLQDGMLFGIGGASVLAGLGFLAMRRRLARRFAAPSRDAADRNLTDREPADR